MVTVVLAGVLGSVLAVGQAAFVPRRDPQIDFKITRIVPKGCIDPGIFIPKRQK